MLSLIGAAHVSRRQDLSYSRPRAWVAVHGGLALIVAAIAVIVVVPARKALLSGPSLDVASAKLTIEAIAGGVNVLLTLAIMALGVFKPRWARRPAKGMNENR